MRALTTSELNSILIDKGYNGMYTIKDIPENKWNADCIGFDECEYGKSYCYLYKSHPYKDSVGAHLEVKANYSKLNATNKKEFQKIVEALKTK